MVKNLVKILLIAQCLLLFCACDDREIVTVTAEQQVLNLADFVKCPFNEGFDENTDLEKNVLKKFGKPDSVRKWRKKLAAHSEMIVDNSYLSYENYEFEIRRGVNKKFEYFELMLILNFTDLKYGINKETTIKDIERLFGNSEDFTDVEDSYISNYSYEDNDDSPYFYRLRLAFRKKKLDSLRVVIKLNPYKL